MVYIDPPVVLALPGAGGYAPTYEGGVGPGGYGTAGSGGYGTGSGETAQKSGGIGTPPASSIPVVSPAKPSPAVAPAVPTPNSANNPTGVNPLILGAVVVAYFLWKK